MKLTVADIAGPTAPTSGAVVQLRPLGVEQVEITGGLTREWQLRNRRVSVPQAVEMVESSGALRNLQIAAGLATGDFAGMQFADSDVYKVLEAVAWELAAGGDESLEEVARAWTELLEHAQCADGYLNSWVQVTGLASRYTELVSSHEHYCYGHLIQAAVAMSRATGESRLLAVARAAADHVVTEFFEGGREALDGHPVIETALVELYRLTGERSYLEQARSFVERRGHGFAGESTRGSVYLVDHAPVRETSTLVGHAVRALYFECGVVDVATETGDRELLDSSIRRWHDTVAHKTALTGGHGSRHTFEAFGDRDELPPDRGYNETCAAVASIHWSWRLLLATGESRYADLIERTLYNGLAAATSVDGAAFFYVNPLQRRPDSLPSKKAGRRRPWFQCACCPPNVARLIGSLGHYVATTDETGVQVHQYVPATLSARPGGGDARITMSTRYPDDGLVRLTVNEAPGTTWDLSVRLPGWSAPARSRLHVAGRPVDVEADDKGYVALTRAWRAGDVVELELDLEPRLTYPHHRLDAVRGCAAVERGPLVYCFEQIDQPGQVKLDDLALTDGGAIAGRAVTVPGLPGPTSVVDVEADVVADSPRTGLPYSSPAHEPSVAARVTARAIPYYLWDSRGGGAMRVWMPRSPRRGHASGAPRPYPSTHHHDR